MPTPSSSRVGLITSKNSSSPARRIRSVRIVSGRSTRVWILFAFRHSSTTSDHAISASDRRQRRTWSSGAETDGRALLHASYIVRGAAVLPTYLATLNSFVRVRYVLPSL